MAMTETDNPPVTAAEGLVPTRGAGSSILDRWVEGDPKRAIERVETMVKTLEQLRLASIRATYPSDWIIHVSRDSDGNIISERGYLQDIGAERAGKIWGIEVGSPAIEEKDYPDGTFAVYMLAEAWSKLTGERLDYVEGSRWSGDKFFARSVGPDEKIDRTDVRKSAYANLHGRAVRALSGLNGVPLDTLRAAGIATAKVVTVDYERGKKGGDSTGAAMGTADVIMAFGNAKGKKVGELDDKDLAWYIAANERSLADPSKAKFVKATERTFNALKAEQERRAQATAHAEATGTGDPAMSPQNPEGEKAEAGSNLRGDVWTRLVDAAGKQAMLLFRQLAKELLARECKGLSDCTEDELRKLAQVPEDDLKSVAKQLGAKT